jgi:hypothetical protein
VTKSFEGLRYCSECTKPSLDQLHIRLRTTYVTGIAKSLIVTFSSQRIKGFASFRRICSDEPGFMSSSYAFSKSITTSNPNLYQFAQTSLHRPSHGRRADTQLYIQPHRSQNHSTATCPCLITSGMQSSTKRDDFQAKRRAWNTEHISYPGCRHPLSCRAQTPRKTGERKS